MSDQDAAGNPDVVHLKKSARRSLVLGALSLPLAFLLIPGAIAVICGYKARRGLLVHTAPGSHSFMAFMGMVMGYLSILIGGMMLFAVPTTDYGHSKTSETGSMVTSLESAVINFHLEYGKMPGKAGRLMTDEESGVKLLKALLGVEQSSPEAENPLGIKFLSVKEGKNRKRGIIYNPEGIVDGLFDPYGTAFTVFLAANGEDSFRFVFAGKTVELAGRRVAVVSAGKDGKLETKDDIKSW
jgi:hypothetical protein